MSKMMNMIQCPTCPGPQYQSVGEHKCGDYCTPICKVNEYSEMLNCDASEEVIKQASDLIPKFQCSECRGEAMRILNVHQVDYKNGMKILESL